MTHMKLQKLAHAQSLVCSNTWWQSNHVLYGCYNLIFGMCMCATDLIVTPFGKVWLRIAFAPVDGWMHEA